MYQDVHLMILLDLILMTFLKKYQFSSLDIISLKLVYVFNIQFVNDFHQIQKVWHTIYLDIETLICGDFAAGAVLITFGALLGKTI